MQYTDSLVGKHIGIVGFGKEGQAVAQFLLTAGLTAHIFDAKQATDFSAELVARYQAAGFTFVFGHDFADFGSLDCIFRSPGVPLATAGLVQSQARGSEITSQTKFFFKHCPAQIIGITGTKGKGTTTSLIHSLLKQAVDLGLPQTIVGEGGSVFLTGNIGKEDPLALLPTLTERDVVVFEMSSFQLEDLEQSPHIGVCLMVTSDHLDHHANLTEYHAAKEAIAKFQTSADTLLFCDDYPATKAIGALGAGKKYAFSRTHSVPEGAYAQDQELFVQTPERAMHISVAKRQLRGDHNLENLLAAALVGCVVGLPELHITKVLTEFKGLEHRLEYVGTFADVSFYNDSIATVPESAIAAVRSFHEPIVLILGGSDKGADFTGLAIEIAAKPNVKAVIVVGQTTKQIVSALEIAAVPAERVYQGAQNMEEIFAQIASVASAGDVVLLSPACASFGMFQSYADRGQQFRLHAQNFKR